MAIQFTDSQTRVLNARHHNILVSAAAGSGKTAVLVERILRMISEDDPPLDIDRLLIVTFTRAAAGEMRERIAKAISKCLEERPDDRHLQRQETLLHRAQITTIDSFCTFLLRNNFSEVDLDPGFRQIDENEAALIAGECLQKFLEEQYAAAMRGDTASGTGPSPAGDDAVPGRDNDVGRGHVDGDAHIGPGSAKDPQLSEEGAPAGAVECERFLACVEYFCPGNDDAVLEKLIRKLYEASSSHPYPEAWLEERKKDYAVSSEEELFECGWYRQMLEDRLEILRETQREYQVLIEICREPDGPDVYLDTIAAEEEGLYAGMREWEERHLHRSAGTGPVGDAAGDAAYREPGVFAAAAGQQEGTDTGPVGGGSGMEDAAEESYRLRALLLKASQFSFGRLPAVRKKADKARIDPARQKRAQDLRGGIKERIRDLGEGIGEDPSVTVQRMQAAAGPIGTLIDLTLGYMDALKRAKRDKNVIDFSDLEHYALQVLIERAPDGTLHLRKAARSYRQYYDEVLIDEYQDSNEVQELLLSAITGEPDAGFADATPGSFDIGAARRVVDPRGETAFADFSSGCVPLTRQHSREPDAGFADATPAGSYARFMVGDVKQSIYRFRNARPEIFQKKFDTYTVVGEEAGPGRAAGQELTDQVNYACSAQESLSASQDARPERVSASSAGCSGPEESGRDVQKERIDLDQNFRSRRQVLDAANGVCGLVMRREVGGVEYDEAAALKQGASYPAPVPERDGSDPYQAELLLVDGQKKSSGGEAGSTGRAERAGSTDHAERAGDQDGDGAAGDEEDGGGPEDSVDEIAEMNSFRKEALAVAQRIRELVGVLPIYDRDTGEQHPARYGDIVILMRSASGRQDAYHEIFEKEGIPLYLEYKGGYFAAEEVRTVLQLLNVIDNPRQDIPLYGVMRGYYGGFSQDEIAQIRALGRDADRCAVGIAQDKEDESARQAVEIAQDEGNGSRQQAVGQSCVEGGKLYGSLLLAAGCGGPVESLFSPVLREKCARFLTWLNGWRERARSMTVSELIGQLVRSTGYEDYVRALPAGARRAANLRSLLVKADAFERSDRAGLFRFLRYIEEMHTFDVDYGEANVLDEHADVVRLTTIHKSKGLEYPVCIVSGLGTKYAYKRDTSGSLILDADLGLGTVYTDTALRCSVKTLRQMAVADKIDRDSLGEELRVLYVAMTRAKEKLILTGYTDDAANLLDKIRTKLASVDCGAPHLPVSLIRGSGNYLNLILESMEMLRAKGQEPIRMRTVQVSDLRLAQLEDQLIMGELRSALMLTEQGDLSDLPSPEIAQRLERYYAYRYPYENLAGLYTKTTVTELKRAAMIDSGIFGETGEVPREMYPEEAYRDFEIGEPGVDGYHGAGEPERKNAGAAGEAPGEEYPKPAADTLSTPGLAADNPNREEDSGAAGVKSEKNLSVGKPGREKAVVPSMAVPLPSGASAPAMADELPKPRFVMEEEFRGEGGAGASDAAGHTGVLRGTGTLTGAERADVPQGTGELTGAGRTGVLQDTGELTGAERGTAVHRMCEWIDYHVWNEPSKVTARMFEDRVAALLGAGEIPPSYAAVLKPRTFLPFLHSDIASRMARADAKGLLSREQPFVLGIAANRLNPQFPEEETILIQGIIDAFFIEEDGETGAGTGDVSDIGVGAFDNREERYYAESGRHIVLVDYKTDRVKTGQELIDRYRVQVEYYTEALERMFRLPVTERILYSFALQQEIYI